MFTDMFESLAEQTQNKTSHHDLAAEQHKTKQVSTALLQKTTRNKTEGAQYVAVLSASRPGTCEDEISTEKASENKRTRAIKYHEQTRAQEQPKKTRRKNNKVNSWSNIHIETYRYHEDKRKNT